MLFGGTIPASLGLYSLQGGTMKNRLLLLVALLGLAVQLSAQVPGKGNGGCTPGNGHPSPENPSIILLAVSTGIGAVQYFRAKCRSGRKAE
jgi:hypothetical protein